MDEKYYINNEKAQKLIQTLIDNGTLPNTIPSRLALTEQSITHSQKKYQTVLQRNTIAEYQTDSKLELSPQRVNEVGFIDKGTGQHQSNTIYSDNGCCPCLNAANHKEPIKVVTKG